MGQETQQIRPVHYSVGLTREALLASVDKWESQGRDLQLKAEEARKRRDGALAAKLERDGTGLIRLAQQRRAAANGTHYWHPRTGEFRPVPLADR